MIKINECKKLKKKCKVCGELKLISDFRKCSTMKDGYRNQCKACNNNKAKLRYSLVCLECGKEFTSKHKKQKFCSVECKSNHNNRKVLCDCCGKSIKINKYRIKRSNHHFCNQECYSKWNSGENHPLYNSEEVLCDYCGKPIKVHKYKIKKNHIFCSTECHGKWNSENRRGENHPNWNSNLTDEDRQSRRLIEGYSDFIKQVFERDNYTCQITGKRGRDLNVHHLNSYDSDKEHRTDINNAITLSKDIHKLFHKLYGFGSNTKEQFEEFKHRYHNGEFKEVI